MYFRECERLVQQHPDLASVFERIDGQLGQMGPPEVIRPGDLASFLSIDPNKVRSALDLLVRERLLSRSEMIECANCEMAAPHADYQAALDEQDEYRCTSCDRPLTNRTMRLITAYHSGEKWPEDSLPAMDQWDLGDGEPLPAKARPTVEWSRLIDGKETVDVGVAARYLELNLDHVRRLVRTGKLTRVGQGRPIRVSTTSLRDYKGQ
jgi:hypothetical protein